MSSEEPNASRVRTRRRRRAWLIGVPAVLGAAFVLVVFVLPTPIARHVIDSQLASLGIEHDGVQTIHIDLWNGRVRAGPVQFRAGDARAGTIGGAGFDYRLGAMFEGRALVTTFYLRGVDLYVARLADGAIAINGVNLRRVAQGADAADADGATPRSRGAPFEAGVERFEFSDSKLVFEDVTGGSLTMTLERLTLERLRTWTPHEPTAFTLRAHLNEMKLALDGTVLPLSDPLRVTLDSRIEDVTLERVARFAGPTGLARQDGRLDTQVRYDYAIHRDGRVEGTVDGTYRLSGLSIATAAGEQATLGESVLKVALRQGLLADGGVSAAGQVKLDAQALSLSTASGDSLAVGTIGLAFDQLDFDRLGKQRRRVFRPQPAAGEPPAAAGGDAAPATAPSIIELMIGWARDLGLNALAHYLDIGGEPTLTLGDGVLRTAARDGAPARELRFEQATVSLGKLASSAVDAGWNANAALDAAVRGVRVAGEAGGLQAALGEFTASARAIELSVAPGSATLAFDLAAAAREIGVADGHGLSLALGELTLDSAGIAVKESGDERDATGPVALKLHDLQAGVPGAGGVTQLRARSLALELAPLTLTERGALAAAFGGSAQAEALSAERGGADPLSLALAAVRAEFDDVRVAPLSASAALEGGIAVRVTGVRADAGTGKDARSLSLAAAETRADRLRASGFDGARPAVEISGGHATLDGVEASLALGEGRRASANVQSLEAPIGEAVLAAGAVRASGGLDARGIALRGDGEPAQSVEIAHLAASDVRADSASGVAIERVAIAKLRAALTRPGEPGATPGDDAPAASSGAPARERQVRIGALSVSPGSLVELTDASLKPPLKVAVVVDEFAAGPFDTGAPAGRSKLSVAVSIDRSAKASLEGWASPFSEASDFDLKLRVDALALPLLSPYAASLAGVDLESGVLGATVDANATGGALDGHIDLAIDDLFVVPVSDKDAEALRASFGVPVGFAVGVLKDGNGRIALGLPLSGTLDEPKVDYGEAVSKAIAGAIASVLPISWFGDDGNTFRMEPATFVAGTARMTAQGKAVADQMGTLFERKPGISIRACGRAARDDLVALRGGQPAPAGAPATADGAAQAQPAQPGEPAVATLPEPTAREIDALLALATERGAVVREYLLAAHGIAPQRIPECRTAYSLQQGQLPRAEFQF